MLLQELNVKIGLLLDEFQKNADKVKGESKKIENVFKDLRTALISYGVFAFLKSAVGEMMEAERTAVMLSRRVKTLGGDFASLNKAAMQYADTMSRISGISDEELKTSLAGLIDVTGDLETSMSLLQDVMDLHISRSEIDMKRATELVGRAFAGERGELTELGKLFGVAQDEATSFQAVMGAVRRQTEGAASSTKDMTQKVGTLSSMFGDLKEQVGLLATGGGFWTGILESLLDVTTKVLKVMNSFQDALRASWANMQGIFKRGFKATQDDAREIMETFVSDTVGIFSSGEKAKTNIDRVEKGKRQKWADDMAKTAREQMQKEKMEVIKAADSEMKVRISKGQATRQQLAALMKTHAEEVKNLYGEMSTQYQEYEAARVEATLAANEFLMQSGQAMVSGISSGFEAMFLSIAEGSATAEKVMESFARAMAKSMLTSIASAIEAEAARGMVGYLANMLVGGPIGGAAVSAYSLPLIATMTATAGIVRGMANMMAEGGTLTSPQLVMMAEKSNKEPETAIPLSRMDEVFQKYSHFIKGRGAGGDTVNVSVKMDNRGAMFHDSGFSESRMVKNIGDALYRRGITERQR